MTRLEQPPLEYAVRDKIPVFPCIASGPRRKHPHTPRGFHDASVDPAIIAAWWRLWPNALIGMPTGRVSRRWVLDIDVKRREANGFDSLADLGHSALPETPMAHTSRLDADILRVIRSDRFLHRPIASSRPGDEALWSTKRRRGDRGHSRSRWRIVARASVEAIETLPPRRSSRAAVRHYHKQATPHAWLDWHLGCMPMVKTTAIVRSSRRNSWRFCPLCIRERRQNDRA
jgi:hypothetical protein